MSIELHIERLVIDAAVLGDEQAGNVRAAIERELARRLAQPGALDALRGIGTIDRLPPASLAPIEYPRAALGTHIAATIGTGLGLPSPAALPAQGRYARTQS